MGDEMARGRDGLPENARKEHFSLGFVQVIAAAAGCGVKFHAADYDGVDMTIASSCDYGKYVGPEFELQVKCTDRVDLLRDEALAWDMDAGPYRHLANPRRFNRAYLAVLLVPKDAETWLDQSEERILSASCMYWADPAEWPPLAEGQSTKRVKLPRSNIFRPATVLEMMKDIGEGGWR
ncbi:DUF4365 domain-containing protein [Embleya sp. NPDC055664]